jgi:hypothetical protein
MLRLGQIVGLLLLGALIAAGGAWGVLAICYAGPQNAALRSGLVAVLTIATLVALFGLALRRWRWRACAASLIVFAALHVWWHTIAASNERDWQTDVAVLPHAAVQDDIVTVHNIRNFAYRSETDYTPAYYDKRFDLRQLEGVDMVAVYWMGPNIAHVFLSFAFLSGDHLAISIETRKEKGEDYSTLKGFFRQYELYYVVADERDVIRLRTNYRKAPPEDVYVYRMSGPIENARRLFLEYITNMNELKDRPEFYDTLTTNCTTNIWLNSRVNSAHLPFSWKILASGHVPEFLYEHGRLESGGLPFAELQRRAHINARAHAADQAADFSQRIRDGNPAMPVSLEQTRENQ